MTAMGKPFGLKKRKRESSLAERGEKLMFSQQSKPTDSKQEEGKGSGNPRQRMEEPSLPTRSQKMTSKLKLSNKAVVVPRKKEPKIPKERWVAAKEMVEARKKKRRLNYSLEKDNYFEGAMKMRNLLRSFITIVAFVSQQF